ncbi:hypothetical protein FHX42_001803 [Saccharopolyspora lacisalsi]|uniref:Zinc-finger n=1 Tax=Halosaccharopolyspora lacisalsi TaxID=1000566 RepID=A0A839DW46_9PSEU|nr:zinc finger protein [Halosaccharopolyspora lacisalsi]MBA8824456.1 hypothetical protein [Halosaccharopolyspora lacisalsi]
MTTELKHHWQPAEKKRHAMAGRLPGGKQYRGGETLTTLCERSVEAAPSTDINWLWPTCEECMRAAKLRVGAPV